MTNKHLNARVGEDSEVYTEMVSGMERTLFPFIKIKAQLHAKVDLLF